MGNLHSQDFQIKFKHGLAANINAAITKSLAVEGEPHWTTDTNRLYVFDGTDNVLVGGSGVLNFVPLVTPILGATLNGAARSTTAFTQVTAATEFSGVPAAAKALATRLIIKDSSAAGTYYATLSTNATGEDHTAVYVNVADRYIACDGIVALDAAGKFYWRCIASGANTLNVYLVCVGYWI